MRGRSRRGSSRTRMRLIQISSGNGPISIAGERLAIIRTWSAVIFFFSWAMNLLIPSRSLWSKSSRRSRNNPGVLYGSTWTPSMFVEITRWKERRRADISLRRSCTRTYPYNPRRSGRKSIILLHELQQIGWRLACMRRQSVDFKVQIDTE